MEGSSPWQAEGGSRACSTGRRAGGGRAGGQAGVKLDERMKTLNMRERKRAPARSRCFCFKLRFLPSCWHNCGAQIRTWADARTPGYGNMPNLSPQGRGPEGHTLALSGQLLLTFLSAALLGQVLFALVKWKLSREAETLFTFRFDRLKNMEMEGRTEKTMVFNACGKN